MLINFYLYRRGFTYAVALDGHRRHAAVWRKSGFSSLSAPTAPVSYPTATSSNLVMRYLPRPALRQSALHSCQLVPWRITKALPDTASIGNTCQSLSSILRAGFARFWRPYHHSVKRCRPYGFASPALTGVSLGFIFCFYFVFLAPSGPTS